MSPFAVASTSLHVGGHLLCRHTSLPREGDELLMADVLTLMRFACFRQLCVVCLCVHVYFEGILTRANFMFWH